MATHKSAEKRARQTIRRSQRNSQVLSSVRTAERKLRTAIAGGDTKSTESLLSAYTSTISRAAQKGVMHMKSASRKISRISERINQMGSAKG